MEGRILVTGAAGQLGSELQLLLGEKADYVDLPLLDITDPESVEAQMSKSRYEWIVNCAAYTAVDRAEEDRETAMRVNALGPEVLGRTPARVIHISTDYVFDGTKNHPYREDDPKGPLQQYGLTKLEGERRLMQVSPDSIILRTQWLYSPFGHNFLKTILRLARQGRQLRVVDDQTGSPTSAASLARAVVRVLEVNPSRGGIYHYRDEGCATWFTFARAIVAGAGLDPSQVSPVTTREYPTPARRPLFSVLDTTLFRETFGMNPPRWEESLADCIKRIDPDEL